MHSRRICLLVLLSTIIVSAAQAASKHTVQTWLTTPDRAALLAEQPVPLKFTSSKQQRPTIDVEDTHTFQTIDGFGFALTGGSAQLLMQMSPDHRATLLRELFAPTGEGIAVSYIRVSIGSSDMNDHVYTYDDMPLGEKDTDLHSFSLAPDRADVIPVLKEIVAINPNIKILGTPWTAPSWMKTNDNPKGGQLQPDFYKAYAQYFIKYLNGMKAEGIPIAAITIQNEPLNPKNTPSMSMSAEEEATFLKSSLGPLLRASGLTTKVILYDHNCDKPEYPLAILANTDAAQYADGSGFHLYGGQITAMTKVHDAYPHKNLYFTEQMVIDGKDDTQLKLAEPVARIVIGATQNWSRNVLLWNLAADPHNGPHTSNGGCPICEGAITLDGDHVTRNIAYYTIAHASKFVPPGSLRIQASSTAPPALAEVAFKTPQGKHVLLVANTSEIAQSFDIRYHNKIVTSQLPAGAVSTYVW